METIDNTGNADVLSLTDLTDQQKEDEDEEITIKKQFLANCQIHVDNIEKMNNDLLQKIDETEQENKYLFSKITSLEEENKNLIDTNNFFNSLIERIRMDGGIVSCEKSGCKNDSTSQIVKKCNYCGQRFCKNTHFVAHQVKCKDEYEKEKINEKNKRSRYDYESEEDEDSYSYSLSEDDNRKKKYKTRAKKKVKVIDLANSEDDDDDDDDDDDVDEISDEVNTDESDQVEILNKKDNTRRFKRLL